jgi:hypothetical protein
MKKAKYIGLQKNGQFGKQADENHDIENLPPDEYIRMRGSYEIEEIIKNYDNWLIREELGEEL